MADIFTTFAVLTTLVLIYTLRMPKVEFVPIPGDVLDDVLAGRYRQCILDALSDRYHAIKRDLTAIHASVMNVSMMHHIPVEIYQINIQNLYKVAEGYSKIIQHYATTLATLQNALKTPQTSVQSLQLYIDVFSQCQVDVNLIIMSLSQYHLDELVLCENKLGRYEHIDPTFLSMTSYSYKGIISHLDGYLRNIDTHDLDLSFLTLPLTQEPV